MNQNPGPSGKLVNRPYLERFAAWHKSLLVTYLLSPYPVHTLRTHSLYLTSQDLIKELGEKGTSHGEGK